MKFLWVLPCLAVCACVQSGATEAQAQDAYYGNNAYAEQQYAASPYAMKPAAYEDENFALNQKEQELFQKEKDLLHATIFQI